MTSFPQERPRLARRSVWLDARDVWVSLAIGVIWLAVMLISLFGPDFTSSTPGGTTTTIPSGIVVAFFALFATMSLAKHGLSKHDR